MLVLPLKLKEDATDDFLDMGKDWMNSEFGQRYVKYSDNHKEHDFFQGVYIGEWSTAAKKPHGRGIIIYSYGIYIGYIKNGYSNGKYIYIHNDGKFDVVEPTTGAV